MGYQFSYLPKSKIHNLKSTIKPALNLQTESVGAGDRMSTYDKIYSVVRQIPAGQVATYGQIADLAGLSGQARLVGYALYQVDMQTSDVPWHRVINAKGEISQSPFRHGSDYLQRSLLEQEGIQFNANGKVNLQQYLWRGFELPVDE